ncbi:MAG: SDR family NAD(P)-dependent oxidoreductase [Bacteroidaceae bacterium]|nr:SDR family NAD(P)-dependent oxidoreductase [Bacteroidaceae bacterium]
MDKKIILVTGASSGIGRATALELAQQGHTLIIHGRNVKKTKEVCDEIIATTGNNDVEMLTADLSLMTEVKAFADKVAQKYDHLDVLINNAGGQFGETREVTKEGHEKTFAINTLAPYLLTRLLLPLLEKSQSARVVTVSSASYQQGGEVDWNDVEFEKKYSLTRSYGQSKRYVWWLMRQFAVEQEKRGVRNIAFNTCEPGSAQTNLARESQKELWFRILLFLWKPMMWSVEKAAATSIWLATSQDVEGKTGGFYGNKRALKVKHKFISAESQKKIWDYCEQACKHFLK